MRLRLIVQRHSLPPVQVLWTAGVLRPPYAAAGASCTISQFLEQVNDIIPLECEDWGLEDYAVEVRGFECLHFAELEQVLKEDDEVCIRPLQTFDLRFRKVSGRHQISADGKHLIDGVAFGRPFIRRTDRPAVRIPPRKRRKITCDEEDEDAAVGFNDRQLTVRAGFDNADNSDDSDDEDDGDFSAVEQESLLRELEDLQNDVQEDVHEDLRDDERGLNLDGAEEASGRHIRSRRRRKTGLGLQGPALIELLDDHGRPYPGEYSNPLLDLYDHDEHIGEESLPKVKNRKRVRDTIRKGENHTKSPQTPPGGVNEQASGGGAKGVRFSDAETMTPATVRLNEDIEVFDAESFEPQNSTESPLDGSDKENAEPNNEVSDSDKNPFIESDTSSMMSTSSESDSEDTSSSDSSSSSGSDSEGHNVPSSRKKSARSPSSSSESDSDSSETDSDSSEPEPEKLSGKTVVAHSENRPCSKGSESNLVAPGHGKPQTRRRNQRRRASKRRALHAKIDTLPPNANLADLHSMGIERKEVSVDQPEKAVAEPITKIVDFAATFEAKRKALLASIGAGGVDLSVEIDGEGKSPNVPTDDTPTAEAQVEVQNSQQSPVGNAFLGNRATLGEPTGILQGDAIAEASVSSNSLKCRAKLDMASSRRLLFGSLGLRAPKTKEDESTLRDKLRRDLRPRKEAQSSEEFVADSIGEDQSWKDKVILSAVECCQEGVELSTPPFPFIQRWDPQQQMGYGRRSGQGRTNNKKRKRKSKQYYEDWEEQDAQYDAPQQQELNYFEDEREGDEHFVKLNSNVRSQISHSDEVYETAVNDQLMREAEGISASVPIDAANTEDLPALPVDMSLCHDLIQESCTPGTVLAFKQLDMSAETNWQPRVSEYRTAIIDQVTDNGTLQMILAKRDQLMKEELYDDETGERVYGKFEMPGYEENEGGGSNGNGIVELSFADLIHPKLIRAAELQLNGPELQRPEEQEAIAGNNAEIVMAEESEELYPSLDKVNPSKLDKPTHDSTPEKVNEQVRKEIRDLISDAGWRSSIGSGVLKQGPQPSLMSSMNEIKNAEPYHHANDATTTSSPRLAGFSSSSPSSRPVLSNDKPPSNTTGLETDESMLPQTVAETVTATSPRSEQLTSDQDNEGVGLVDIAGRGVARDDARRRLSFPQTSSKAASQSSPGLFSQGKTLHKSIVSFDGADSDDEFPTLENVLASTRSSFESVVPHDEYSTFAAKSSFESIPSADEDQKRHRRSKSAAKRSIREQSKSLPEFRTFKEENDGNLTPRPSQIPPGTQVVDLTQSSDAVYAPGSDEDDHNYVPPSGPGWVKKTRASSKQLSLAKGESLRSRTRSSV